MNKNCRFWILENFSRTCLVYDLYFRLNRFPKGCDADHSNYVSIFINQVSGPPVWVKYAISLLESQSLHRSPFVHNTRRGSVQFVVDRRSSSRGTSVFQVLLSFPFPVILFVENLFFVKSQRSLLDILHLTSFLSLSKWCLIESV